MRGTRNEHVSTLTAEAKKGTRRTEENRKKRRVSSETTCRVMAEWGSRGPRIPVAPRDYRNDAFFSSLPFVRPFSFLSLFFCFLLFHPFYRSILFTFFTASYQSTRALSRISTTDSATDNEFSSVYYAHARPNSFVTAFWGLLTVRDFILLPGADGMRNFFNEDTEYLVIWIWQKDESVCRNLLFSYEFRRCQKHLELVDRMNIFLHLLLWFSKTI